MRRIALGGFINLSGFAMPSHKMLGQNEMDPGVAACIGNREGSNIDY
jgi:hypothetical protein